MDLGNRCQLGWPGDRRDLAGCEGPSQRLTRFQILVQKRDGALPGKFCSAVIVAGARIVVEGVIDLRINVAFMTNVIFFQRSEDRMPT